MIKKHTQNKVDEPGPQLVVEPPPQGQFPLSDVSEKQIDDLDDNWAIKTGQYRVE